MTDTPCKPRRRKLLLASALTAGLPLLPASAYAQASPGAATDYPTRLVTIIVPFAPGGGTDIVARVMADEFSKRWKSTVIVQNKPGAGGQIGNAEVARAKPDGYTLLLGITTLIQAPGLYKNLPYDAFSSFTPLAQIVTSTNFFVVPASSPANSIQEFIALAKANKGKFNYSSTGNAGSAHLTGALFNSINDLGMEHIPFAGSAPQLVALLGGQVECGFVDIASLRPHLQTGKLKFLASTGLKRNPALPNVPVLSELGIGGFEPVGWFSLLGPASMPEALKKKISDAAVDIVQLPASAKRFEDVGLTPAPLPADVFAKVMRDDKPKWDNMIRAGKITVD